MATIKDVARRAGVSAATVSHVVNRSRAVSKDAEARVREAIAALKYRRDGIARSLRVSHSGTLALLISDITNPFFGDLVRGIESVVRDHGDIYNLLLCNTEEDDEHERRAIEMVLEKRIDGLIIVPTGGNRDLLRDLIAEGVPAVLADRFLDDVAADTVVVDNREASRAATGHLIRLGHRRIAAIAAELNASSIRDRLDGYRDALREAGIGPETAHVVSAPSSIDAAVAAGLRLLAMRPAPTAIFCTNNFMTLGVVRAVLDSGRHCPRDISVVSFDDFPWSDSFQPRLTAVSQPGFAVGREAATLLLDRISGRRQGPPVRVVLPTRFVVRESAAALVPQPA